MNTAADLARQLRADYDFAPSGRRVASIHLFGIRHAAALQNVSKADVVRLAGLSNNYATELSKGVALADYVTIKPLG